MAEFKEVLKHSSNYMIANLATRALAFISLPLYTRLLSTEDYGVTAVFMGIVQILASIMALSCDRSVSRYYFDRQSDQDFKNFVGTTILLSITILSITSTIIFLNVEKFANLIGLPAQTIKLLVPLLVLNMAALLFEQIYQPQKKSKVIASSSLTRVYLGFGFAIGLILLMSSQKYMGQIWGQILAAGCMMIYWIKKIAPYVSFNISKKHIKYILTFSVPLIPYALSGVIIEQFGKITVGSDLGMSESGFYSLAISIASLTAIITEITHQAWSPYYFEYMNKGDYKSHDKDLSRIFKISVVFGLAISCFGQEIGLILAKSNFTSALYLVPILVLGYLLHQISYAYMRNFLYARKTLYMSFIVISSGVCNVLLNLTLIPRWGILGSAISVVCSYFVMAILGWLLCRFAIKVHAISLHKLLIPMIAPVVAIFPLYYIMLLDNFWLSLLLKIVLFCTFAIVLLYSERVALIELSKKILTKFGVISR